MRVFCRFLPAAVLLISCTSCIPVPHPTQDLPRITGTITRDGQPMSRVVVHVADITRTNPCERAEQRAESDSAGRFVTEGRRRMALWVPLLPVHGLDTWAVALFVDGAPVGYIRPWNYRAGPRSAPREVALSCELADRKCRIPELASGEAEIHPCETFTRDLMPRGE